MECPCFQWSIPYLQRERVFQLIARQWLMEVLNKFEFHAENQQIRFQQSQRDDLTEKKIEQIHPTVLFQPFLRFLFG